MPRNSLPRADATVSLDHHLRRADQLPAVLSSQSLFGNDQPLELEIGSGKGLFLQTASGRRPDHNFLGIEIAYKYAAHAAGRLAKQQRLNAMMVAGDAEPLLEKRIAEATLAAVHIYFPDPWWKKKHKKRRVINPASVRHIYRALRLGGTFHFWTDVLEYFESAIEMIAIEVPQFGPPLPEEAEEAGAAQVGAAQAGVAPAEEAGATGQLGEQPSHYRTHFERRSRLHQIPVYRVKYQKAT
jgi:tRNA (guanine-N7-)-methyltransferase